MTSSRPHRPLITGTSLRTPADHYSDRPSTTSPAPGSAGQNSSQGTGNTRDETGYGRLRGRRRGRPPDGEAREGPVLAGHSDA